jgi:hypothetical protein
MKKLLLLHLICFAIAAQAQVYRDRIGFDLESIADIDIGWMKMYKYTTPPAAKQLGERKYSAAQIGYSQQFIEWMQQSYTPKGCLGNAGYYQNAIYKFSSTNSRLGNAIAGHVQALPHLYGAYSRMYMYLKKDAAGNFVPQNNLAENWNIEANGLQHISMPVSFISSTEEYYFVFPDFKRYAKGYDDEDKKASNFMDFDTHKNIKSYRHFYVPPRTIDDYPHYIVILSKNNELPFEEVTIGEFFEQAEKQFPFWQSIDPVPAEQFATAQKNMARLKLKYKSKWNEVAKLDLSATEINLQSFVNATEGYDDFFDNRNRDGKTFPILKVKKEARKDCKTAGPQWLVIRWTMGMPTYAFNIHLHESILNNFNFDYVYNFFFDPEKVKGQAYKPLRSPNYKETVVVKEASEVSKKNAADKNIFFFEDFSTTDIGKKPLGWQVKIGPDGTTSVVKNVEGLEGNWAVMGNSYFLSAAQLKKPLPQNFTLSYDLVASQNFTWGSNALTFQLSKETSQGNAESYLKLKLRPGFDGRDGETELETNFNSPPGYATGIKWYKAPGFSNNKRNNKVTVIIKKKEERLQVFIDGNKIVEYEKAIPAALLFNAMSFYNGSLGENDRYYISNIKIAKE